MIIGICGGSGSGKTTLLNRLCREFGDLNPSVFSMDNYYKPLEQQKLDDRGYYNFDLPSALDYQGMVDDLKKLINGEQIIVKEYHFNAPPDKHVLITIPPSKLIIVEGLFLFHYSKIRELLDYSIFINVDPQVQLDRRLYRDQESRGYSREDILYQWKYHVTPCYENYLLPYELQADFKYRNDSNSDEDFQRLISEIGIEMGTLEL